MHKHDSRFHTSDNIINNLLTDSNTLTLFKTAKKYHFFQDSSRIYLLFKGHREKAKLNWKSTILAFQHKLCRPAGKSAAFHHSRYEGKAVEWECQLLDHRRNLHLYYTSQLILDFWISVLLQSSLDQLVSFSSTATNHQNKQTILLNASYIKNKVHLEHIHLSY